MNEVDEKVNIDLERQQLNLLIKRGVKFDVESKVRKRKAGLKNFFKKPEIVDITTTYEIQEPTLSVLDRLCDVWLDMALDEEALLKEGAIIVEAKNIAKKNAEKMARIIAIAVLGEDYIITEISPLGIAKTRYDDNELNRLTKIFFHSIKPSKLAGLTTSITNVSNLADFIASMRLMSGARTTKPIADRIE